MFLGKLRRYYIHLNFYIFTLRVIPEQKKIEENDFYFIFEVTRTALIAKFVIYIHILKIGNLIEKMTQKLIQNYIILRVCSSVKKNDNEIAIVFHESYCI